jgi:hypothetical protein
LNSKNKNKLCKIWGFHGDVYEESRRRLSLITN